MPILKFTIGEVADLLEITPKTIRHYHAIGLLEQPERDTNNYRLYGMAQIEQLQRILQLKRFGLSLQQIKIIVRADNPDELVQIVLRQHADNLRDEIARLQHELTVTEDFLRDDTKRSAQSDDDQTPHSALVALTDAIKPHASGVADVLVEVEHEAMAKLDRFNWDQDYELFWHHAGKHFLEGLQEESLFIFWMERYLALSVMAVNDLQGRAWLDELQRSPARRMLAQSLMPPAIPILLQEDQQQISKLLPSLLHEQGAPLQKQFLQLLMRR